ncbi:MAG: nucleotidyltransferase family protein [Clostridiales bacterium]|nr:nucleotidyltransferase family protein [Clostridiales bacterium]
MKAIILAAGYATRLYPLTIDKPKALLPIAGRTILDRLIDEMHTIAEIDEIHLVTNHRFAKVFEEWNASEERKIPVTVWDDGTTDNDNRLGAIGDVNFVLKNTCIDDDLLIAASDNLFTFPLKELTDDFHRHGCDCLLGKKIDNINDLRRFAVATLAPNGQVTSLVEKPAEPQSDIGIYAIYCYRRDTVPMIAQYLEEGNNPDAPGHFPEWLYQKKDVRVYTFDGECVDIGTVEAYHDVCERWAK